MGDHFLDNRGLTPPEPMIRTLKKLDEIANGESLVIVNDRQPMFLYPELEERGYQYETEQQEDGSYKISIHKR
ncbi:MAG TPA: DUF2249 domain-containing protein [Bacillota bacterium]|nr:DUF2249 domain-containing protein [Bacillota bacterium]